MNQEFLEHSIRVIENLTDEQIDEGLAKFDLSRKCIDLDEPEPDECKGLIYRYQEFSYPTSRGGFRNGFELHPQKRLSCTGCSKCAYLLSDHADDDYYVEIGSGVASGDLVRLSVVVDSTDWETGYADGWHVVASKITRDLS